MTTIDRACTRRLAWFAAVAVGAAAMLGHAAPPTPPASPPAAPPAKPPRSLDDLLGTGGDGSRQAPPRQAETDEAPPPQTEAQAALRRALTEAETGEAFAKAIAQMSRSAERLSGADAGIDTQRIQEDVIATLDLLLRQPPRRNSSSSSSSSRSQSDPSQAPPSQSSASAQPQRGSQPSGESAEGDRAVPRQESALEQALESAGVEWGNLPERVRDVIRQGVRDRPSSLYQRLTEEYYRRLAEEASR